MSLDTAEYLAWLEHELTPLYKLKEVIGHDADHVRGMIAIGRRIKHLPGLDLNAFDAAVWLHNLDRVPTVKDRIDESTFEEVLDAYLQVSPFSADTIEEIIEAVVHHSKKDDEPGDSLVMRALRAADKVDRLSPTGALTAAQIHGHRGLYDPTRNPFVVELGQPGGWPKTVYDDIAGRLMEWPLLLPPEARYLIDDDEMRGLVQFVVGLSNTICLRHGLINGVQDDLRRALGYELYERYAV